MYATALVAGWTVVPAVAAQQTESRVRANSGPSQVEDTAADTAERFGRVPQRFVIDLGGYLPNVSTHARVSTHLRTGSNVNFENQLGLAPNTQTFNADASWRISRHNFLSFDYFSFGRSGTKQIGDSIVWGSNVYRAGSTIDGNAGFSYYGLSYRYYIWRESNWELGPGFGIDGLNVSSSLAVQVATSGPRTARQDSAHTKASVTVPVPLLGLFGDWEFVPRVFLKGGGQFIYINNINNYGGRMADGILGFEWYPFHNFGLGGVYHYIALHVSKTSARTGNSVKFDYTVQGPALYVAVTF